MQIVPDPTEPPIAAITDPPAAVVADPPEPAPAADPPADPPAADPPAPVAADPPAPAPKAPSMVPLRVLQERVGEVTRKKDQDLETERRARADAERRAAEFEAILQRVQRGEAPPAPAEPRAPAAQTPQPTETSFEEAVQRTVTQREAARSINAMVATGRNEFTAADWNEKAEILGAVGAATPEFVMDVIAADSANAHKIIYALAQDPERAAALANMDVRQRTAELTRMSMAEQAKAPAAQAAPAAPTEPKTQISKAPAPKPPIAPHAPAADVDPTTPEGDAKMSDQQFEKWYKEKYYKKTA